MASFWLEYIQDGQHREFSFDAGSVVIGRDKTADFVLDHPTVSRQHAMIRVDPQGPQLVVLSRGGLTAIDGGQVQGEVQLYDGSEIHFGQLSFTFRSHAAPRRAAPQSAPSAQAGFAAPSNSFPAPQGAPAAQPAGGNGGWGNADWNAPAAPEPAAAAAQAPQGDGGIVSWDQIANSAEAQDGFAEKETDFQRIQAAQAKADKQTKGNNPWLIYGALIGVIGVVVLMLWPVPEKALNTDINLQDPDKEFITWEKSDIDCVGRANCRAEAMNAYKVGKNLNEQAGADITNPYESYKQFERAQRLLLQGGIEDTPDEMADILTLQTKVKAGLDVKFKQAQLNFRNFRTRKMYKQMAGELNKVQAYFPDKRCLFNQWAVAQERQMKDDGVYPAASIY